MRTGANDLLAGKDGEDPGVAIEVVTRDFATGKEADQRHIPERPAHDLQLGTGPAKMRPATPGTTDVNRAGNATGRMRGGLGLAGEERMHRLQGPLFGLQFFPNFGANTDQIGARRLQTVMERILEDVSFSAPDRSGETVVIDAEFVERSIGELARNGDLSRYIL